MIGLSVAPATLTFLVGILAVICARKERSSTSVAANFAGPKYCFLASTSMPIRPHLPEAWLFAQPAFPLNVAASALLRRTLSIACLHPAITELVAAVVAF